MSCYDWEHGTIKLPAGQAPILRKLLAEAAERRIVALTAETDRGWDYLKKLSLAKRRDLRTWDSFLEKLDQDALWLLQRYDGTTRSTAWARPTQKQIRDSVVRRYKDHTGATVTVFLCGSEATISLCGNTVEWDVPENNHATERAGDHPLAVVLFRYLDKVTWTSRSGGEIIGNNEYNRDSYDAGGGGNYVVREYSAAEQKRAAAAAASRGSRSMWAYR